MAKGKKVKKQKLQKTDVKDFEAILQIPERLAQLLRLLFHLSKPEWDFCVAKIRQKEAYREWRESKGPGKGFRQFGAPCAELKLVQKRILQNFLANVTAHFIRHGNQPGSSMMTNVQHHAGFAKAVFGIDLVNAFPSVFRSRIRGNLRVPLERKISEFGEEVNKSLSDEDKKIMLEAVVDFLCLHDRLPQGPPTSPRVLDIVCFALDRSLAGIAAKHSTPFQQYRLTAYADNFTLSSNDEIPEEVKTEVLEEIKKHGFIAHTRPDKTEYYSPFTGKVPVVTGIVLPTTADGHMTMAPRKVNQLRARLHQYAEKSTCTDEERGVVMGTIGYIRQVYPKKVPSKLRALVEQIETRARIERLPAPAVPIEAVPKKVGTDIDLSVIPSADTAKPKRKKPTPKKSKLTKDYCGESLPF
ncbi:hypothetical protein HZB94_02310 [Candidatus Falkowbacteria bacterium]|nr:hypothetical protein [Candidatus Falkowbacteria bacterium]